MFGVLLINLLSVIFATSVQSFTSTPKHFLHLLQRINAAMQIGLDQHIDAILATYWYPWKFAKPFQRYKSIHHELLHYLPRLSLKSPGRPPGSLGRNLPTLF